TFIGVGAVFLYVLYRFPSGTGRRALYTHGNHRLEMIWTAVPGLLLLLLAIRQIPAWARVKLQNVDEETASKSLQLEVTARQWEWRIRYPGPDHVAEWRRDDHAALRDLRNRMSPRPDDVRLVNEVHCVKDQRVLIHLKTLDVIHSFFLPHMRL